MGKRAILVAAICFGALASALPQDWGVLMIDLGASDISAGILLHPAEDGFTEPITIGGKEGRIVPPVPPAIPNAGNHIYFIVDPSVMPGKAQERELWVGVEYYDRAEGGAIQILMDYDDLGDLYPNQAFALDLPQEGRTIALTNTEEWKLAILFVDRAEFKEQGNGGDFRFHVVPYMTGPIYLDRVWVSNHELTEEELLSVRLQVEPFGKLPVVWGQLKALR